MTSNRGICLPAASACFDMIRKDDGLRHEGFAIIEDVMPLNKLTMGLTPVSNCFTWPLAAGRSPNHVAVCMNWVVSFCLCYSYISD